MYVCIYLSAFECVGHVPIYHEYIDVYLPCFHPLRWQLAMTWRHRKIWIALCRICTRRHGNQIFPCGVRLWSTTWKTEGTLHGCCCGCKCLGLGVGFLRISIKVIAVQASRNTTSDESAERRLVFVRDCVVLIGERRHETQVHAL